MDGIEDWDGGIEEWNGREDFIELDSVELEQCKKTMPRPYSLKNKASKEKGFELIDLEHTVLDCNACYEVASPLILNGESWENDTLKIDMTFKAECGFDVFFGEIEISEDEVIHLYYSSPWHTELACICCFRLIWKIKAKEKKTYKIQFLDKKLSY